MISRSVSSSSARPLRSIRQTLVRTKPRATQG
jgi:hypothetical protein